MYKKCTKIPPLTKVHCEVRPTYARNHITYTIEGENIISSDEKKFNLDGPDYQALTKSS